MSNSSTPAIMIYPVPVAGKQPQAQSRTQPPASRVSNGSFGTVFIVLAVITVISGLACFIGRLCNNRTLKSQQAKQKQTQRSGGPPPPPSPYPNSNNNFPNQPNFPPQQSGRQERDMELGYPGSHQPNFPPQQRGGRQERDMELGYPGSHQPHQPNFPPQQRGRQERDMELGYPGSHQPHPGGPKDYSDTDNEFDKRSKSSNSKPPSNGEGARGGFSPSPFGARVRPDHGYSPELRSERHGSSP